MANNAANTLSRRQALRRGAAAGAVIWTIPMVASTTAHATSGSFGSKIDGRLSSVTCVWVSGSFRPHRGTPTQPKHNYANDTFCEIQVGKGWQLLAKGDQFTVPAGQVLQFRPWSGHAGGNSAEPADDVSTQVEEPVDVTTTTAPAPIETPVEPVTTEPTTTAVPVTTEGPTTTTATVDPVDAPATGSPTTTIAAPAAAPTTAPAAAAPESYVDTIVIDMSGRTDLNVGDVFGYFQIVDADPI